MFPTTHVFTFATAAPPWDVWSALTDPQATARCYDGVALHATWEAGQPFEARVHGELVGGGEVLAADPWDRLAYAFDGGTGPDTYVTWQVRNIPVGSIVTVHVDEMDGDGGHDDEVEGTWMPVLRRLQAVLAEGRTVPAEGTTAG
jgi:uncharacterized protein YndB with AHSA1/START domain